MNYLLLALSIVLSTGRNIFSKKLSDVSFGTGSFYLCQSVIFFCGGLTVLLFGGISPGETAISTVLYAVAYGLLLILAQWFYTSALSAGNVALCSTVYSMGFIFPTLSGAIFWGEALYPLDILGIFCAVLAVIASGLEKKGEKKAGKSRYFIPIIIAMTASGGLGIVQKMQQSSDYPEQKSMFLLISFALATSVSLVFALISGKNGSAETEPKNLAISSLIGAFFGFCNLLNTTLAGALDSAIFFPVLNIGVILLSMICTVVFFKEKIRRKEIAVLILGGASILLLNLG